MSDRPALELTVPFAITSWDATPLDGPGEGPRRARAVVGKRFDGDLVGTSIAEVVTTEAEAGRGYIASEQVDGAIRGRRGTFVLQHGGLAGDGGVESFGHVVPGSGTGDLAGLAGSATYAHDADGARLVLRLAAWPPAGA